MRSKIIIFKIQTLGNLLTTQLSYIVELNLKIYSGLLTQTIIKTGSVCPPNMLWAKLAVTITMIHDDEMKLSHLGTENNYLRVSWTAFSLIKFVPPVFCMITYHARKKLILK